MGRRKEEREKEKLQHKKRKKYILRGILITLLILISVGAGVGIAIIKSAPALDVNFYDSLKQSGKLYDKNGTLIGTVSDVENRQVVPLAKIPKHLQNAFIAIEDERFKTHHGIDMKGIFRAIWYDIKTMSRAQGASTITQQLIKNTVLTPQKKFTRKIQEMYLAIKLERMLSKDQILEYYLNTIFLGGNAYGVQSASHLYFGKDVWELNAAESAFIAGLTKYPARYYPYSKKNKENPETIIARQHTVLKKMLDVGKLSQQEYDEALKVSLEFKSKESMGTAKYQWFIEAAVSQIAEDFSKKYNISESEARQKLRTSGYSIYLTIDTKIQEKAEEVVENPNYYPRIPENKKYYSKNEKDEKLIQPQAAAVVVDSATGEVKAIVGGRGPHPLLSYNRATDPEMARQPGSSIKPLAVYAPAIENRIATPATVIEDSPMSIEFVNANKGWDPKNYDRKFRGYVTVRNAIKDSINLVAVKLEQKVGVKTGADFLINRFHMSTVDAKNDRNIPALALGGMTYGVTPLDMASAYSVFANNGIYSEPIMYTLVKDNKDRVLLEKESKQTRSMSPEGAYLMADMLQTVVKNGTGKKASLGRMPSGGKTGTTDSNTNGWYVGFTPYYSGAVWIGHDDKNYQIKGLVGGTAAPMWREIMKVAHKDLSVKSFTKPSNIVTAKVCLDSGNAPSELCANDPRGSRVYSEIFIEGTQPVNICDIHVKADIDKRNGKLANPETPLEYIVPSIFIKRDIKSRAPLLDDAYVVPTEYSDITAPKNEEDNPENKNPGDEGDTPKPKDEDNENTKE